MPTMTPVASQIIPPNPQAGLDAFSKILGLKQQEQAIAGQAAEVSQEQQKNQELKQAQSLSLSVKNGAYRLPDGSLNRMKLADDIASLGPYAEGMSNQLISQSNEIVANQQAHQNLNRSQQQQMGASFGALAANGALTRTDIINTFSQLADMNPSPDFHRMLFSMATHLPTNASPQQLQQLMRQWSIAATSPEGAAGQTNPAVSMVQGPHGLVPTNVNPQYPGGVAPVGPTQAQGIPPTVVTNPVTQAPTVMGPQGAGGGGAPQSNASPAYPRESTMQPYPGEQRDIAGFQQMVDQVRTQGDQAPLMHNINQSIMRLSESAKTGPGSSAWQHAIGALGAPFGLSPTASYQEVSKFLEKNAISNMQAMGGPPSDARLSAAAAANGGPEFSPKALQYVTRFNDATVTGLEMYREGLDKAVGTVGPNYLATPAFRSAWAKNFDIRVFELHNALESGDKDGVKEVLSGLTRQQAQALNQKWENLKKLAQTGSLQ